MSNRDVKIAFKSHMYDTDEQIDVTAMGLHSIKDEKHYLMYTEESEGGLSVRNILKFNHEGLEVSKIGITRTNMYYKAGYKHTDVYRTPLGEFDMCIDTKEYRLLTENDSYKIVIVYDLELGGSHVSKCKVEIEIELS